MEITKYFFCLTILEKKSSLKEALEKGLFNKSHENY